MDISSAQDWFLFAFTQGGARDHFDIPKRRCLNLRSTESLIKRGFLKIAASNNGHLAIRLTPAGTQWIKDRNWPTYPCSYSLFDLDRRKMITLPRKPPA